MEHAQQKLKVCSFVKKKRNEKGKRSFNLQFELTAKGFLYSWKKTTAVAYVDTPPPQCSFFLLLLLPRTAAPEFELTAPAECAQRRAVDWFRRLAAVAKAQRQQLWQKPVQQGLMYDDQWREFE